MNNQEKNSYVRAHITEALLKMMEKQDFDSISVCKLTNEAGVCRASFYRNFRDKEDVLRQESVRLTKIWGRDFENNPGSTPYNVFESLFNFYSENGKFYQQLYKAGLSSVLLDTIVQIAGPNADMDNNEAYGKAFIAYGIYGWVNEWISRGMMETGSQLNDMLIHKNH
ncbi:MAG: TetR/AcrR family transcriptional regulator [Lachnospiraceae bacterium]